MSRFVLAITAVVAGCSSGGDAGMHTPPVTSVDTLEIVSGASQTGKIAGGLSDTLVARVVDSHGAGVAGKQVNWTVSGRPSALDAASTHSASDGSTGNRLMLDTLVGASAVSASLPGVAGEIQFVVNTVAGAPAALRMPGVRPLVIDSGSGVTLSAQVEDRYGNDIPSPNLHGASRSSAAAFDSTLHLRGLIPGQAVIVASLDSGGVADSQLVLVGAPDAPVIFAALGAFELRSDSVLTIPIVCDFRGSPVHLGSATLSVMFDPSVLTYLGWSPGATGVTPVVNDSLGASGNLRFSLADAVGYGGRVELIRLNLKVVHAVGQHGTLSVKASEVNAAGTFANLLPRTILSSLSLAIH